MKSYPSISKKINHNLEYYFFDKLDGSNIRAEWSKKNGFYKFGSRTQLLTPDQEKLYPSIDYIKSFVGSDDILLSDKLNTLKVESAVCFFEWYGPQSFAGNHVDRAEDMKLSLIDVDVYKKGLVMPENFIKLFNTYNIPKVLYKGKVTVDIFQSIKTGTLDGMTFEGVVLKQAGCTKDGRQEMYKIKNNAWLDKLKNYCNGNEELFARLS